MIKLVRVGWEQGNELFAIRKRAFQPLLERYQDYDTNPAAESWEKFQRYFLENSDNFLIQHAGISVGTLRVVRLADGVYRLSPLAVLPEYQGNGYAQQAVIEMEKLYPQAKTWCLDTIKQEPKLLYLYSKLGYRQTGEEEQIKDGMDLVFFEKKLSLRKR